MLFFFFQEKIEEKIRENRLLSVEYKEQEAKKKEKEKKKEEKKEEEKKKPGPELKPMVATITMQQFLMPKPDKIDMDVLKKLERIARPMDAQMVNQKIDLDKMMADHSGQAKLDAGDFAAEIELDGVLAVVGIGSGISTEDILAGDEFKVPLDARALPANIGAFGQMGFSGTGKGSGGIDLDEAGGKEAIEEAKKDFKQQQVVKKVEKIGGEAESGPKTDIEITGALADRKLERMPLPPYPEWAQQQGISAYLNISLKVGPSGKVEGMVLPVATTGYSNWDNMVIEWIKKNWQWEKKPGLTSPGNIGIRFTLG
ncbi:MAG: hypothetical protein HY769_03190 [Candidatus Stahlbacteria bacterium]|nr:hypothetical protein [Candidatus Stahlbacteria bacterium]